MLKPSYVLIALGVVGLVQCESRPATAQVFGLSGNLTGLPYNYFQSQQELPFYAKFPPVYYSYPVARPYGYSPFAYPPGFMTPGAPTMALASPPLMVQQQAMQASEIVNPFVPEAPLDSPAELPAPSSDARRPAARVQIAKIRAKVILNPFVAAAGGEQLTANP